MPEHHEVAVAAGVPAGGYDAAGRRGRDPGAESRDEVETGMESVAAWPEAVTDRGGDGACEPQPRPGRRPPQSRDRCATRHAVNRKSGPALKPLHRGDRVRAEPAV